MRIESSSSICIDATFENNNTYTHRGDRLDSRLNTRNVRSRAAITRSVSVNEKKKKLLRRMSESFVPSCVSSCSGKSGVAWYRIPLEMLKILRDQYLSLKRIHEISTWEKGISRQLHLILLCRNFRLYLWCPCYFLEKHFIYRHFPKIFPKKICHFTNGHFISVWSFYQNFLRNVFTVFFTAFSSSNKPLFGKYCNVFPKFESQIFFEEGLISVIGWYWNDIKNEKKKATKLNVI